MIQHAPIVLASQSTARADVLRAAGLQFTAQPARVDEAAVKDAARAEGASPEDTALILAGLKARRVRAPGAVVIGADQLLVCGDRWFDKPADPGGARDHLLALRGQDHTLVTAIVCMRDGAETWRHVARPTLTMRRFSDAFLDAYLEQEAGHVLGCVGAYRLEGPGVQLFERVDGEHAAILGLPLLALLGYLRQCGVLTS